MGSITLDKLFDLLLENVSIGKKVDVKLSITKNRDGGWSIEYWHLPPYKIEPKKEN